MNDDILTPEEDLEFYNKKSKFLYEFFKNELLDLSKGEIFIVSSKYENDYKLNRFKLAQYIDNCEYKYIAFQKDLPKDIKVGDIVRKFEGNYILDISATKCVTDAINKIKREIIDNRNV